MEILRVVFTLGEYLDGKHPSPPGVVAFGIHPVNLVVSHPFY
jgi:hypothetical protein